MGKRHPTASTVVAQIGGENMAAVTGGTPQRVPAGEGMAIMVIPPTLRHIDLGNSQSIAQEADEFGCLGRAQPFGWLLAWIGASIRSHVGQVQRFLPVIT